MVAACRYERREPWRSDWLSAAPVGYGRVTRPILIPWSEDTIWLDAPAAELPAAYVSMETRQAFIDYDFRERVYWELSAHISVSTGLWRLPLHGDPPKEPVMPGDVLREFEELSMREWDPTRAPTEGDIRFFRGRPAPITVELRCVQLAGGGQWFNAGPWRLRQRVPSTDPESLCREDFRLVGTAERFTDRECTEPAGSVGVLTWAGREPDERPRGV